MGKQKQVEKKSLDDVEFEQPQPILVIEKTPGIEDDDSAERDLESGSTGGSNSITKYRYFAPLLALALVITGSLNTLIAKWTDTVEIDWKNFNHPFFQGAVMFVGEVLCLIVYLFYLLYQRIQWKRKRAQGRLPAGTTDDDIPGFPQVNPLYFAGPALCDVINAAVQYTGLNMTSASSYQMLRGASIVFTGILAVIILKNRLQLFKWVGMVTVTAGLAIVGICDMIWAKSSEHSSSDIIIGDLLIVAGEVMSAIQAIVEQKLLNSDDPKKDVPALLAVGLEGVFGLLIMGIAMIPLYFIHVDPTFTANPENRLEDAINAFWMMQQSTEATMSLVCNVFSIALFNFAGLSVTKFMSATTRMVLNSIRTIVIWAVSIPLFHETFIPLQILGFVVLIIGMFVYQDVLIMPMIRRTRFYTKIFPDSHLE